MRRPIVMWLVISICVALFVLTFVMAYSSITGYREQVFRQKTSVLEQPLPRPGQPMHPIEVS